MEVCWDSQFTPTQFYPRTGGHLKGTVDFTGRSRDTYDLRGVGAVPGLPVSSTAEEQVLGSLGPEHPYQPYR